MLITETKHGFICANSGVDVSNVDGGRHALLLPADPDRSAGKLHRELKKRTGLRIPVLITDTFGRPWREGLVDFCIGIAGMKALRDDRGRRDPHGYALHASVEAIADELACAAALVCGKLNRTPACIIRGFRYEPGSGTHPRSASSRGQRSIPLASSPKGKPHRSNLEYNRFGGTPCPANSQLRNWKIFLRLTGPTWRRTSRPNCDPPLERILETQNGNAISQEEAYALAHAEGDDLLGLLAAANLLRAELCGNLVTYVVNRNINFTNICFVGCKFCAFSRGPRESDTYFLEPDQVAQKAVEAWQLGATEVCIQGGLPHGLPPFYYRDILRAVKNAVPAHAHPRLLADGNCLRR